MPTLRENEPQNPEPRAPHDAAETKHFVNGIDYLVGTINIGRIQNLSFAINDIPYHVTHKKDTGDGESRVCIQAVLGYLPFSIESSDDRRTILAIIDSTRMLFNLRFGLDFHGRIFAAGNFTADTLTAPDFIFFPLMRFLQEAQPFIDLIGQHL
jgi:hypothetical protein